MRCLSRLFIWVLFLVQIGCTQSASIDETPAPSDSTYQTISGQVQIGSVVLDSDNKDLHAQFIDNNDPARPQPIQHYQQILGWADAENDAKDFFQVSLNAGQSVFLQVLQASATNDLDLFVFSASASDADSIPVGYSQKTGPDGAFESINIVTDGVYLILVEAVSGGSSYALQFKDEFDRQAQSVGLFKTGEAVVQHHAQQHQPMNATKNTGQVSRPLPVKVKLPLTKHRPMALSGSNGTPAWQAQLDTLQAIKALNQEPNIEYAEPNFIRHLFKTPNDSLLTKQHALEQINLSNAWDISTGEENEVIVAVLDTGVYMQHEDLKSKLVDGYDFISDLINAGDGDGIDNDPDDPGDDAELSKSSWHGTHVAGIVAAQTNNNKGMAGVSWSAKIMPLRVMGRDGGYSHDIAQAIYYAAGLSNDSDTVPSRTADIINMSFGAEGAAQVEREAIAAAQAAGVIVVAAMGNDGQLKTYYPAGYADVIAVAATNPSGQHASYSNYGAHTSIAAPGGEIINSSRSEDGILSTFVDVSSGTRNSAYAYSDGTSMATPHVAGVLALMKSANPELTNQQILAGIRSCLLTKRPSNSCSKDEQLGYGEIDARQALEFSLNPDYLLENATILPFISSDRVVVQREQTIEIEATNPSAKTITLESVNIDSGSQWLTLGSFPEVILGNSTAIISATINAAKLPAGTYTSNLIINYLIDGHSHQLRAPITLKLPDQPDTLETSLYIRLEDIQCSQQANADNSHCLWQQHSNNGKFEFELVPSGRYRLSASTDIQGLGQFCLLGEACAQSDEFVLSSASTKQPRQLSLEVIPLQNTQ